LYAFAKSESNLTLLIALVGFLCIHSAVFLVVLCLEGLKKCSFQSL
jgi:hypothetical protein